MNLSFTKKNEQEKPALHVILASQSVGRKTLLDKLGIRYRVVVTNVDEESIVNDDPHKMIAERAHAKAEEVITHPRIYGLNDQANTLVLAADSMAVLGKKTFGKAKDKDDAREILKSLMDRTHTFVTSVCIVHLEANKEVKRWEKTIETKVSLRKLSQTEIDSYINRFDFTRYAAAYALTETPWDLVTKIDGSYTNVIGLPFEVLLPILRKLEIIDPPKKD